MKNEKIKVTIKGKISLDVLNKKQKEIFFSELLSAFLSVKKEQMKEIENKKERANNQKVCLHKFQQ